MFEFQVSQLHLAAYIKANGGEFVKCADRVFYFRSAKALDVWTVEHMNSCCRKVDLQLIELRRFLKTS